MISIRHNRAALVELIIATAGISGLTVSDHLLPDIKWKIGVALILCLVFGFFIFRREKQIYTFGHNDPKLGKFFAKWYSGPGDLTVYCTDLEWVEKAVQNALTLKAADGLLSLYLRDVNHLATHLKSKGAIIYQIAPTDVSPHRFSILRSENFERILCRNKIIESADSGKELIEFIYTTTNRDPHLIALARDVLTQCPKLS